MKVQIKSDKLLKKGLNEVSIALYVWRKPGHEKI
jgi:hypothetical protein